MAGGCADDVAVKRALAGPGGACDEWCVAEASSSLHEEDALLGCGFMVGGWGMV
jgi:hypothetical protein